MTTVTEICNVAMAHLGVDGIEDFASDESRQAVLCRQVYGATRRVVLSERAWQFAKERAILSPKVGSPVWGYDYAFEIPSDVIFVHRCYAPTNHSRQTQWDRVKDEIHSNQATLHVEWIVDVENPAEFSAGFVIALGLRLARDTCLALTESRSLYDRLVGTYRESIDEAGASDGRQGRTERMQSDSLITARRRA